MLWIKNSPPETRLKGYTEGLWNHTFVCVQGHIFWPYLDAFSQIIAKKQPEHRHVQQSDVQQSDVQLYFFFYGQVYKLISYCLLGKCISQNYIKKSFYFLQTPVHLWCHREMGFLSAAAEFLSSAAAAGPSGAVAAPRALSSSSLPGNRETADKLWERQPTKGSNCISTDQNVKCGYHPPTWAGIQMTPCSGLQIYQSKTLKVTRPVGS